MTTAAPSTALVTIQPAFTDPERFALARFLAGYRGRWRDRPRMSARRRPPPVIGISLGVLVGVVSR
jgi:hypothetical protein